MVAIVRCWRKYMLLGKASLALGLFFALFWVGWTWAPRGNPPAEPPADTQGEQTNPESETGEIAADALERQRNHLARMGAARWHARGLIGRGMKVAILDSGFRGWRNLLGKSLPAEIQARSFRKDGLLEARDSQHGILCAEIVHSLAPGAQLLLANWEPDSPDSFLQAVAWAKNQGARILTCSLIMPSWSDGEGGGEVHEQLGRLLGSGKHSGDLVFCACAGNTALRHWSGDFAPDATGVHQWQPDRTANLIVPWGPDRLAVELYGPGAWPARLEVRSKSDGKLLGADNLRRGGQGGEWTRASVRFNPDSRAEYEVRLVGLPGKESVPGAPFHLMVLGGNLETAVHSRSISFPADGERCLAVGAVDEGGQRRSYSACGPNSRRPKPDFVAHVPFPSLIRARPFSGTSAAAPQAAGIAALLWSSRPDLTPIQVHQIMRRSALDLSTPGHDHETGFGQLRLPDE